MGRGIEAAEWRDIPGYDGAYQLSRDGQVRTWRWRGDHYRKEPRLLVQYVRRPRANRRQSRRRYVKLTDPQGRAKEVAVMRLMVEVWLGGYPPGMVAYHKNGDHTDLRDVNIGFVSPRKLGKVNGAKSRRRPVAKIDRTGEAVEFFPSARKAAKAGHMSYQAVTDRCNGRVKRPYALTGYTYRWDDKGGDGR